MSKLRLSLAMGDYDRTRPIADGRVAIDGVDPVPLLLGPEEMFFRAFRHAAFDISELSLSSYCVSIAGGEPHYIAVPVFLSRAFRHTAIYIRTDRGIAAPRDLAGREVGIAEYQLTANVWARAILADHGVRPQDIQWVQGGMDAPGRPEKIALDLPSGIRVRPAPEGATLDAMLAAGEIDAFIGPRRPRCFRDGHPQVARLFPEPAAAAAEYYRRTGIFPIMHVLGLRRRLAAAHPWLPGALMKAFTTARRIAEDALADTSAPKVTMAFVEDALERNRALLGAAPWTYGLDGNTHVLETFLEQHHAQGLAPRRLSVDELFHPAALEAPLL